MHELALSQMLQQLLLETACCTSWIHAMQAQKDSRNKHANNSGREHQLIVHPFISSFSSTSGSVESIPWVFCQPLGLP